MGHVSRIYFSPRINNFILKPRPEGLDKILLNREETIKVGPSNIPAGDGRVQWRELELTTFSRGR
jgi:hypothetical protein